MLERAPRKKKRLSCVIISQESRYSGIVLDVSASGMFVQTSLKPNPGAIVEIRIQLPGLDTAVSMEARIARKKSVPPQLLTLAQGGVGVALIDPAEAYLDFVETLSPEHAAAVATMRSKPARKRGKGGGGKRGGQKRDPNAPAPPKRFRIHAVETATGNKGTYIAACETEQEAGEEVLKQLGGDWQVLFVEIA